LTRRPRAINGPAVKLHGVGGLALRRRDARFARLASAFSGSRFNSAFK
jgi:hypothetical protein